MTMHTLSNPIVSPRSRRKIVTTEKAAADVRRPEGSSNDDAVVRLPAAASPTQSSIESLIAKHYPGLRLLILRRTGDPQVAADLLNEAVCTTWEKWQANQIERPEQIAGYIFQVAMNLLRNQRRKVAARPEIRINTGQFEAVAGNETPDDRGTEEQIAARVKKLIRTMGTPRDRLILTRFYLDEEDKESICRDLGLDSLQFDKVLHRARGRLRELLEAQGFRKSDLFSVMALV